MTAGPAKKGETSTAVRPLIFCLGASHKSAPVELREGLYLPEEELALALPQVKAKHSLQELIVLSTCNRFELIGVAGAGDLCEKLLIEALIDLQNTAARDKRALSASDLSGHTYLHVGVEAIKHVFAVASSLDSLIVGETQITGQFKDAVGLALQAETLGPILNRMSQEALGVAKKVRTQTDIGKKPVSISHAAIDLAKRVFGDIGERTVLLVGAGEMAEVAAKYLISYKPREILIANRSLARAQALVTTLGAGKACALTDLATLVAAADIVISSTAAPEIVIDAPLVQRVQRQRRRRPLFLIDIALPRDIDPACGEIDDVYLFDIDDLQQVITANFEERRLAAEKAQAYVETGADGFERWLDSLAIKPALGAFRAYLDDLMAREAARTLGREAFQNLRPEQRAMLDELFAALASKIAADAGMALRQPPDGFYADQLADALRILFPDPQALPRKLSKKVTE